MRNKLLSIDAELDEDSFKGLEMRVINDTEKFTSQVHYLLLRMYDTAYKNQASKFPPKVASKLLTKLECETGNFSD